MNDDRLDLLGERAASAAFGLRPSNPGRWEQSGLLGTPTKPGTIPLCLELRINLRRPLSTFSRLVDTVRGGSGLRMVDAHKIFLAMGLSGHIDEGLSNYFDGPVATAVLDDGVGVELALSSCGDIADLSITVSKVVEIPDSDEWFEGSLATDACLAVTGNALIKAAGDLAGLGQSALAAVFG